MPIKRLSNRTPRKPKPEPSFDYEDEGFLARVRALAYEGFYNAEIADELNVSRTELETAISRSKPLRDTLEEARAHAKEQGDEMPSPAKFAQVWAGCQGKRSVLMRKFNIGWTRLQEWLAQEPAFVDIMAERDLEFMEQADIAGRILTLGGVEGRDEFPGWTRHPDPWMLRFYMNTLGRRYGYGENPVIPAAEGVDLPRDIDRGVDIESWIRQEIKQAGDGKEEGAE